MSRSPTRRPLAALLATALAVAAPPASAADTIEAASPSKARLKTATQIPIRLVFPANALPAGTEIVLTGADGATQRLTPERLSEWRNGTAFFNGGSIVLEIIGGGRMAADLLTAAKVEAMRSDGPQKMIPQVIIGTDERVASDNRAIARMDPLGCTGWLTAAGVGLAAGHCFADSPPPQVLQFDVPQSLPDGTPVAPPPAKQFPIDMESVEWHYDENKPLGDDWAVFRVRANALGQNVFTERASFFRLSDAVTAGPKAGQGTAFVMVDGYGADETPPGAMGRENSNSQTEQQSTGALLSASNGILKYTADTMPGNSGSPVFLPSTMVAVGIHDGGGDCGGTPCNTATSFANGGLVMALEASAKQPSFATVWVDAATPGWIGQPSGSVLAPFRNVNEAIQASAGDVALTLVAGQYEGNGTVLGGNGRTLMLVASAGTAVIGHLPPPVR